MPRSLSTAPRTSAMGSGGILSDRISLRCSALISPTAALAVSSTGWIEESSCSISALRAIVDASCSLTSAVSSETSDRRPDASDSVLVIISIAASADCCAIVSLAASTSALRERWSTVDAASSSLAMPRPRFLSLVRMPPRMRSWSMDQLCSSSTNSRGDAPPADSCIVTRASTSSSSSTAGPGGGAAPPPFLPSPFLPSPFLPSPRLPSEGFFADSASSTSPETPQTSCFTPSTIRGSWRIEARRQSPIQRMVHAVNSAGLDSQRSAKSGFVGSMATQTWSRRLTRAR
mmetsp:Transcript_17782/g.59974  ORF Transcript_17782/g.59974 Transcript_17782/m.59974 type:complete len:289 (+) Transcript_17782:1741-2607(+)